MSQEYGKVVKAKLSFKGDSSSGSKHRKLKRKTSDAELGQHDTNTSNTSRSDALVDAKESAEPTIVVLNGTGRITSSGTTVQGHETQFMNQLKPNDAIIILHPVSMRDETKIVRMVLSNVSIGISSAFSSDLITTTPFKYVSAPKDEVNEALEREKQTRKAHQTEEQAFGTYASAGGEKLVYRVKNPGAHGGYKIVTETINKPASREQLLDMRKKKKADRYCF